MTETPRLICDAMLGRLARKLRLAGIDTLYHHGSDSDFVAEAVSQRRIPVTRDLQLSRRRVFRSLNLVPIVPASSHYRQQFKQVLAELKQRGYRIEGLAARCPECNMKLSSVDKFSVAARVPAYVFINHEEFSLCPGCLRIYWKGTHHSHFVSDLGLEEIMKTGENDVSNQDVQK